MRYANRLAIIAAQLCIIATAKAHHGSAPFDTATRVTFEGVVTEFDYSFVLEDPEYLIEPVTGGSRWDYRPDRVPDDVPCDIESAGRY